MDRKIVKMTPREFAEYLLKHNWGIQKIVEFALTDEKLNGRQYPLYSDWWYCTFIDVPEHNTLCVLFDKCGGGCPHCAPVTEGNDYFIDQIDSIFEWLDEYNEVDGINVEVWEEGGKRI